MPVRSEVLKPDAFLRLAREDPRLIESSRPIPPRLGGVAGAQGGRQDSTG